MHVMLCLTVNTSVAVSDCTLSMPGTFLAPKDVPFFTSWINFLFWSVAGDVYLTINKTLYYQGFGLDQEDSQRISN